jgi:hypothetical protein
MRGERGYLLMQRSVSLVPTLTNVLPVASLAFCVKTETQGRTVDLVKLIVAAAALSALLIRNPANKLVRIVLATMCPPGTGPVGSLDCNVHVDPRRLVRSCQGPP